MKTIKIYHNVTAEVTKVGSKTFLFLSGYECGEPIAEFELCGEEEE
jgi:hypothetical protein